MNDIDFNDIKSRLQRTLSSLNARFDEDYNKHSNIKFIQTYNGEGVALTFGKDDRYTIENKIIIILQNLATLKDHLKNSLHKNGYNKNIIEDEINSSIHLQVFVDIVNEDKHEYPLTRTNRSNKNPIIKNATQALIFVGSKIGDVTEINISNKGHLIANGISPKIIITGEIFDDSGNFLFNLNELVETCYSKWLLIAETYKIL